MVSVDCTPPSDFTTTSDMLVTQISPGQPRGFLRLPIELVLLIAQHLSNVGRFSDLAAFSRLLKIEWRYTRVLQEVLFGSVHVDTYECYSKLSDALQSGLAPRRGYHLAPMVRCVSATFGTKCPHGQQPFLEEHLLNLYSQCPQLTHITLAGSRGHRSCQLPIPAVGDIYPIEQLGTIRSLTLVCPFEPIGCSLLRRLPHLTDLYIAGGNVRFQLGDHPPLSAPGLRRVTWGASTPPDVLSIQWLFGHSEDTTGGEINLLVRPHMNIQLEQIRDYALRRKMSFHSPPELRSVEGNP